MKQKLTVALVAILSLIHINTAKAFDWGSLTNALKDKDNVENLINGVIGSSKVEVSELAGTWVYKNPAIQFESEDALKKTGGIAMSSAIEKRVAPYFKRIGMDKMVLTITPEGEFEYKFKKGGLKGTLTKEGDGTFMFNFQTFGGTKERQMKAYIKKGTTLEITYDISKLLDLMEKIASKSKGKTLKSAVTLLQSYKGMYAGFEMSKE